MTTLARRWPRQDDFDTEIRAASVRYGVAVPLIKAVIAAESGFNPNAYNPNDPGGAWGLMQVIEGTARMLGHKGPMADLFRPSIGIDLGTKYLGQQQARYSGALADTVASYNAGTARSTNGVYSNQTYVTRVMDLVPYFAAWEREKGGGTGDPVAPFLILFGLGWWLLMRGSRRRS